MFVALVDHELGVICTIISCIFEFLRLIIAAQLAKPPSIITQLEKEKMEVLVELASIKSVQVELVRSSKLERRKISLEKQIEKLEAALPPMVHKVRKIVRIIRAIVYSICGVYFNFSFTNTWVILIESKVRYF